MLDNPLVSVIVTTHWSARTLERCLSSVKNQTYSHIEIIVVDTASNDFTPVIGKQYADKFFEGVGPERSAKRNFGVQMSKGRFVFIVDSDMELDADLIGECVKVLLVCPHLKAVAVPEKSVGDGFWARCKALERSFYVGVEWMEAARFFDRESFLQAGGYDISNTGSEDYDLPNRLKQIHGNIVVGKVSAYVTQHEGTISFLSMIRKKFYYSKSFVRYSRSTASRVTFRMQADLLRRYCLFFSAPRTLFQQPILGLGMLFLKTAEFSACGFGYVFHMFCRR